MSYQTIGKLAGAIALTISLAGCIDMTMEVEVLSDTTGKATVTSSMGPDIYPMVKAGAAGEASADSEGFCKEKNAVLTENPDGGATCVQISEGEFKDLDLGDDKDGVTFTAVSPGVVRMAFKTADMKGDLASSTGGSEEMDEETKAMMTAFFEGHTITIRAKGKSIGDTNMTKSADGTTAETVIPFLDLINGTATLPDELYAVINTK